MRNDTPEIKMGIHQILTKNGFYRLPMHSLTQILRVLEVSQSVEPKAIQENAIDGIIKIIQKNGSKFADAVLASKIQGVSKQTKDYVCVILNNAFIYLTKGRYSNLYQPSVYQPNMNALSGAPGVPGVPGYPPMRSYSFMNAPGAPSLPTNEGNNDPQNMKMMNQMIRLQQAYMYYYGLYGYMNPYASYGGAQGKQQMNPSNPFLPSLGGGMTGMPMGPMGPMGPMAPMAPGLTGMNHVPQMGQMNPMSFPHKNPQVQTKPFEDPISNMPQRNSAAKQTPNKESQPLKITQKAKSKPQQELYKPEKNYKNEDKKAKSDKSKFSIQNPPFIVNETTNTQANQTKKSNAEKNASQNAKNLQNSSVTTAANQLLKNCVCKGAQKYEQQFLCSICNKTFHYKCLSQPVKRAQNKQSIECYHCRLRFIDPLNKVKEVIAQYYIPNINDNKFWMSCNLKPYENFCRPKNGKNQIQMRCLKVASAENSEITWPDQCIIKLNGERIIQIPALQINSSLKKRKDYSIIITQNIYNKSNQSDNQGLEKIRLSLQIRTLTKEEISHRKIKNNFTFAFAIYFVQRLSVDELYQKIVNEQKVPEPSDYLQRLMRTTSNEIEIDKITISLFDPFTWDLIKTPVRGSKCQHGQCFDLKTFISFMSTARNRTWKCPICGKDARKFMVDSQQMELIKRVQESNSVPSEIAFMKDGKIVLKKDETEDAGQNSSVIHQKTKKIKKQSRDKEDRQSDSKRQSAPQKSNSEYQQPRQASKQLIYNQQSKKVEKFDPQVVEIHQIDEDDDNDKVQNNNEQQIVRQEAIEEENNPS